MATAVVWAIGSVSVTLLHLRKCTDEPRLLHDFPDSAKPVLHLEHLRPPNPHGDT